MLGEMHKLVDRRGMLMGVLFTPPGVQTALAKHGGWRHAMADRDISCYSLAAIIPDSVMVQTITLVRSHAARGAVELWGMTPGELSKREGFAFLPAVDYVAPAAIPEVERPDPYLSAARDVSA